jgi:hypothetical protein
MRFLLYVLLMSLAAPAIAAQQPILVSVNQAGNASANGNSGISDISVSADGRFVVFVSDAPDLAPSDANGTWDLFVRDLQTGTTVLASVNAAGTGSGNGRSGVNGAFLVTSFAISGNGRFIAFSSEATDLAPNDTNGLEDIFVRDLQTGTTSLVTINAAGSASGNGFSIFPFITPDGSTVSFRSNANDLVANDTNATTDIFVRRLSTGVTSLVSVNAAGTGSGNGPTTAATISDDGRYVAFMSSAGNLVSNDTNGTLRFDIFLRDLQTGTTTLISVTPNGAESGNQNSTVPIVSAGGGHVFFASTATNLVSLPDNNSTQDVFVRDIQAGTTFLVSVNSQGTAAGLGSSSILARPGISANGNIVVFISLAPDLVNNDGNGTRDVFVRNISAGTTSLVSVNMAGTGSGQLPSGVNSLGLSADGRFVCFESISSDLVPNDPDTVHDGSSQDVFLRDLQTSTTRLISTNHTTGISANNSSVAPALSRDGSVLVFSSNASDLVANDTNNKGDVFAFRQPTQVEFSSGTFTANESDGVATFTVRRTGDRSSASTVDYATSDGTASERSDYLTAVGTLRFAANETEKTISVFIVNDSYGEPGETFNLTLSNPSGATLGTPAATTVTITSDEIVDGPNPVKWDAGFNTDFFVRQHYVDFLNREADAPGLAFWKNQIDECTTAACREIRRINVSAAFFLSIEFQETGYLVERLYKTAYGDATGTSTFGGAHQLSVPVVRFREFLADTQQIGQGVIVGQGNWQAQLEANKQALIAQFVLRPRFTTAFPTSLTPAQFVDTLNTNAGNPLSPSERNQLVSDLTMGAKTRAQVLRAVAEDPDLFAAETNRAFVLAQFFGYLRRNPNDSPDSDYTGYDFWLSKLNQFNGNFVNADMVKAFIVSGEYELRFGP